MVSQTYLGVLKSKSKTGYVQFTRKVQEYVKCSQRSVYFARKYVKIINVDKGLVSFNMYDFQENMIKAFDDNRFSIYGGLDGGVNQLQSQLTYFG